MEEVIEEGGELNDMNEEAETLTETFNFEADDQIDLKEFEEKEKQEEIEPKEPMDVYSKRLLISNIIVFIFYSIQTLILVYLIHFFSKFFLESSVGLLATKFFVHISISFSTDILVLFKFKLGPFISLFSFVSALHHLIVIVLLWTNIYEKFFEESKKKNFLIFFQKELDILDGMNTLFHQVY